MREVFDLTGENQLNSGAARNAVVPVLQHVLVGEPDSPLGQALWHASPGHAFAVSMSRRAALPGRPGWPEHDHTSGRNDACLGHVWKRSKRQGEEGVRRCRLSLLAFASDA